MTIAEKLKAAWAVIDSPEKWTQGLLATDINGRYAELDDEKAVCFCSIGAILKVSSPGWKVVTEEEIFLDDYIRCNTSYSSVASFNDSHTYEEVAALWKAVIEKAEKEGV